MRKSRETFRFIVVYRVDGWQRNFFCCSISKEGAYCVLKERCPSAGVVEVRLATVEEYTTGSWNVPAIKVS